jgi:hypothetical protein
MTLTTRGPDWAQAWGANRNVTRVRAMVRTRLSGKVGVIGNIGLGEGDSFSGIMVLVKVNWGY